MPRRLALLITLLASAALAAGCGAASPAATVPVHPHSNWNGLRLFQSLSKVQSYADTAQLVEAYNFQAELYNQEEFHAGSDYRQVITGKPAASAFLGATSLIYSKGDYYIDITSPDPNSGFQPGWYSLGSKPAGTYQDVLRNFAQIGAAWRQRLAGSTATVTGSCSALGRSGTEYRVKFNLPPGAGPSPSAYGTACVDKATGAPLAIALDYSTVDSAGGQVTFQDRFTMTAFGTVPAVLPPANSTPAPTITLAP